MEMSCKRVPDSWSCDVETVSAKFGPRPWHKHVAALSQTKVRPTSDVDHRRAPSVESHYCCSVPAILNTVHDNYNLKSHKYESIRNLPTRH